MARLKLEIEVNGSSALGARYQNTVRRAALAAANRAKGTTPPGYSPRISIALMGKTRIQALNRDYRSKDRPTDVLAFPLFEKTPEAVLHVGDIALCPEVARRNAEKMGHSLKKELITLTVHGVLHLYGYDHETSEADARKMFRLQNALVAELSH